MALAKGIVTSERESHALAACLTESKSISFVILNALPYLSLVSKSAVCIAGFVEALKSLPPPFIV